MDGECRSAKRSVPRQLDRRSRRSGIDQFVEDSFEELIAVEVEHRPKLPNWLKESIGRAEAEAMRSPSPRLAALVVHEVDGRSVDDLVILRLSEFRTWHALTVDGYRGNGDDSDRG